MVQRARLPAQGFYKELPVVISNSIRRSEDRKTSFEESMKDVASLLQTTKEPTSSLNQKSYIPITVKSNRELLSPALSETDFEEKVLPEINRIVESLVSEDTSENAFPQSPNESTTQNMDVDTTGWSDAPEQPRAEAMHVDTPSTHEQSATHDTHMPGGQGSSNNKAINHSDWKSVMLLP
ncbi:hypothetical protein C8R42DRAFT_372393 [Lentinula raphanica]|nr:hypothetical protein C8R42DRAFT_372393 [Lentinula raphanica]